MASLVQVVDVGGHIMLDRARTLETVVFALDNALGSDAVLTLDSTTGPVLLDVRYSSAADTSAFTVPLGIRIDADRKIYAAGAKFTLIFS